MLLENFGSMLPVRMTLGEYISSATRVTSTRTQRWPQGGRGAAAGSAVTRSIGAAIKATTPRPMTPLKRSHQSRRRRCSFIVRLLRRLAARGTVPRNRDGDATQMVDARPRGKGNAGAA